MEKSKKSKYKKKNISKELFTYISILAVVAFALMIYLFKTYTIDNYTLLVLFSALSIIAETFLVPLPKIGAVSVSFALYYSAIILTNPLYAAIISAVGVAFRFPYVDGKGRVTIFNYPVYKTIFNASQLIINSGIAGMTYVFSNNYFNIGYGFFNPIAGIVALVVYILFNTLFMSELMHLLLNQDFTYIWKSNFFSMMISVVLVGLLGILLAFAYNSYRIGGLLLFFIPLLLARYSFKLYLDMKKNNFDTMNVLVRAIEANDPYTSDHSLRVSIYSEAIANELKLPQNRVDTLKSAALLHDIGKIGIDQNILHKKEKLENKELEIIRTHPEIGANIIADLSHLTNVADIIRHHHERNDGNGYPDGLNYESISLETSILTIADSFDAMTTDRPYRNALSMEKALNELRTNAGTQFNPDIIEDAIIALKKSYISLTK